MSFSRHTSSLRGKLSRHAPALVCPYRQITLHLQRRPTSVKSRQKTALRHDQKILTILCVKRIPEYAQHLSKILPNTAVGVEKMTKYVKVKIVARAQDKPRGFTSRHVTFLPRNELLRATLLKLRELQPSLRLGLCVRLYLGLLLHPRRNLIIPDKAPTHTAITRVSSESADLTTTRFNVRIYHNESLAAFGHFSVGGSEKEGEGLLLWISIGIVGCVGFLQTLQEATRLRNLPFLQKAKRSSSVPKTTPLRNAQPCCDRIKRQR